MRERNLSMGEELIDPAASASYCFFPHDLECSWGLWEQGHSSRLWLQSAPSNLIVKCLSLERQGQLWDHKYVTLMLYSLSLWRGSTATFSVSSWKCPASSRQDRYPVAAHCSDRSGKQNCQWGSGYCFPSDAVYCSTQQTKSLPHAGHTVLGFHSVQRKEKKKKHFLHLLSKEDIEGLDFTCLFP